MDLGGSDVVVRFETEPAGAVVQLDGRLLCSSTPCSKAISTGRHAVRFQAEGYRETREDVEAKSGLVVHAKLWPTFARLTVATTPPALGIAMNGEKRGRSPVEVRLDPGSHSVVIDDGCYLPDGERIAVAEGAVRTLTLAARPRIAGLRVTAQDGAGNDLVADVVVDGEVLGKTPFAGELAVCSKELVVRGELDGAPRQVAQRLELVEGKVAVHTATLEGERSPVAGQREAGAASARGGSGAPPSAFVIDTIIRNNAAIQRCYAAEIAAGADVSGKIYLKFSISPHGAAARARITTSRFAGTRIDTCVSREVNQLKFPAFDGETQNVRYPFNVL